MQASLNSKPPAGYSPACEPCGDTGWLPTSQGARRCSCLSEQIRKRALKRIPPLYRGMTIETVEPRPDLHEKQATLLTEIKTDPTASYLLFGRNGCGKSLVGWLLYRAAIDAGRDAVGVSCAELLREMREWERDPDHLPLITPENLRTDGRRYLLFVDEFDKARPSEYAGEMMYLLFEAAYSFGHQVVITANMKPQDLSAHWSRENFTYGPSILRRLMEIEGAVHVDMF